MNSSKLARLVPKHTLTEKSFSAHILTPLGVMFLYFVSLSWLLREGVNRAFVTATGQYVIPITVAVYIAFFAIKGLRRMSLQFPRLSGASLLPGDMLLLLLPLTPIAQYILNNDDILSGLDSILIFCVFALCASIPILVIPILLRNIGSVSSLMSLGLAFVFSITNMASLSHQFGWYGVGTLKVQLAVFGGIWLVSWLLLHFNSRSLLYLLIVVYFLANSVSQLIDQDRSSSTLLDETDNKLATLVDSRQPVVTPNIYLLIYDAYVVNETMLGYGLDNQDQEQYLEDLGFRIYPHTYSVAGDTTSTMSRVLNASVDYYGAQRKATSGDGIVQNELEEFGYKTYGIFHSDYHFRGTASSYDYSFPGYSSPASILIKAILVGEFRFDIGFDAVSREQFIEEKHSVFSKVPRRPRFIYMHSALPGHSQNSGTCLPNEVELYGERLEKANLEMQEDLEIIIEHDPEAIVIVAGDHGPYLTKTCHFTGPTYDTSEISRLDIQDRFGTFLAIRWPTADFEEYDDITVLQDLFPSIFAYMFAEPELLEAKIEPVTVEEERRVASGTIVVDGVLEGGINDGEPLFVGGEE